MHWETLQRREKIAVVLGALGVILALVYATLSPLLDHRGKLRDEVKARQTELAWMQAAAREVGRLKSANKAGAEVSPLKMIDQAARDNNLSAQLKRLEPTAGNEIRVWLDAVVYVDLVHWLRQLTGSGRLALASLQVDKSGEAGLVNARLTFSTLGGSP